MKGDKERKERRKMVKIRNKIERKRDKEKWERNREWLKIKGS